MGLITSLIIGALSLAIGDAYTLSTILDLKKIDIKKHIILVLILSIYLIISYITSTSFLRYSTFIFIIPLIVTIIYKKSFKETFLASIFNWIIAAVLELILAFILITILKIKVQSFFGAILSNVFVSLMLILTIRIPKIKNFCQNIIKKIITSKKYYVLIIPIILALSISIIVYINYFEISNSIRLVLSIIIIFLYTCIVILLFNEKYTSTKIQYQYDNVLKNLEEYEKMLDYQRVANHENKNQLLVIKGMIKKNEKGIDKYIDSIVKEKREDNEDFYTKTKRIPSGGLQGLIYYKLLIMKDKDINIGLNINSNVRKVNLEKLGIKVNKEICKIIGVLLDNSIQAVENLKEKNIDINMFIDKEKLNISISNNFSGDVDFSKIGKIGYTTKGNGHGYGLSLVKKIISNNDLLENYQTINGKIFIQNITIKINK